MARLLWNSVGERHYQSGVDRGVLYLPGIPGVPWNGLSSINVDPSGGEAEAYYYDGYKYLNLSSSSDFKATIEAYSAPVEFNACDGITSIATGLNVTQQPRKSFGFSYRTLLGNDTEGLKRGYLIHMVYRALTTPASRAHKSLTDSPDLNTQTWSVTTKPEIIPGVKPTAHLYVDSTQVDPARLDALENALYGDDTTVPYLPTPSEIVDILTL